MPDACQKHLSVLVEMGVFTSVLDISDNPVAAADALPVAYDMVVCGSVLKDLPRAKAVNLLNNIKHSGASYFMAANPDEFLCAEPFYLRVPLWRFKENESLTYDIWATDDYNFYEPDAVINPVIHNPTTSADLQRYAFFRKLCALPFIEKIEIYGSRSVGKSQPDSDLDIMLYCNPPPTRDDWLNICGIVDSADLPLEIDCKWDDGTLHTIFYAIDYVKSCLRVVYQKPGHAL